MAGGQSLVPIAQLPPALRPSDSRRHQPRLRATWPFIQRTADRTHRDRRAHAPSPMLETLLAIAAAKLPVMSCACHAACRPPRHPQPRHHRRQSSRTPIPPPSYPMLAVYCLTPNDHRCRGRLAGTRTIAAREQLFLRRADREPRTGRRHRHRDRDGPTRRQKPAGSPTNWLAPVAISALARRGSDPRHCRAGSDLLSYRVDASRLQWNARAAKWRLSC